MTNNPVSPKVLQVGYDSQCLNEIASQTNATITGSSRGPQLVPVNIKLAKQPHAAPCLLSEYGVVSIAGEQSLGFLQGQLTNDVSLLTDNDVQLSGFCTPKGRLLVAGWLWRLADQQFYFLVQRELAAGLAKRLSQFVMRSKVKVQDVTEQQLALGLWDEVSINDVVVSQSFEFGQGRRFGLVAVSALGPIGAGPWQSSETWFLADCKAGLAFVTPTTTENFVPQMLNLDLRAGVSFKKGCYPGQEIVARSHYLGKSKRRLFLASVKTTLAPSIGADVVVRGATGSEPVGQVVNYAATNDLNDEFAVLIECQINAVHNSLDSSSPLELAGHEITFAPLDQSPNADLITVLP
jgi:tRNA-modifying protein YgfZ